MHSLTSFAFSCRMRLSRLKRPRLTISLSIVSVMIVMILGPLAYQESWLDPFSTLGVPNQKLHPHAITKLGILNSDDPFHPYYYTDIGKIQELIGDLQRSTPLPPTDQALGSLENKKVQYITLHRARSYYHTEEDYALQYYPEIGIIRFSHQAFRINESTVYALSQISARMTSGWWK